LPAFDRPTVLALWVALGGAFGATLRHVVDRSLAPWMSDSLMPAFSATLTVNLLGSALIGGLAVLLAAHRWDRKRAAMPALRAFLITGLLGGMTTASLFSLELLWHLQTGHYGLALAYWAATLTLCPLATWLSYRLVRRWVLRRVRRGAGPRPRQGRW